jgi:hypothetical protein
MGTAEEALQAVSDKLHGSYMEVDVISLVQNTFPARNKSWIWTLDAEGFGSRLLVAPMPQLQMRPEPVAAAHGEVLVRGGLRVPIVVMPVGASPRQLHRLSEAAQAYARHRAADRLGVQLCFIAVRRNDSEDPIEPANWTARAVRFK